MTADVLNAGLPPAAARLMARADSKAVLTPDNTAPFVAEWCVGTIFGNHETVVGTACDVRRKLQAAPQNNFIEDHMQGTDTAKNGILQFNVHMDYYPGNQVVSLEPLGSVNTDCSNGLTFTAAWFGFGISATEITCSGIMAPQGLGNSANAGGYWTGDSNGQLTIEQALETNAPVHINPDSTLYLFQLWPNGGDGAGDGGSCPDPNSCHP